MTVDGPFTNSVESCNTPAFNLSGMTKQTCDGTPTPTPTPTPRPRHRRRRRRRRRRPGHPGAVRAAGHGVDDDDAEVDRPALERLDRQPRRHRLPDLPQRTPVGTTTSLSYTVTGLACGTSYTIGLTAVDAAGNESIRAEATGTTSTRRARRRRRRRRLRRRRPTPTPDADADAHPTAAPDTAGAGRRPAGHGVDDEDADDARPALERRDRQSRRHRLPASTGTAR